MNLRPLTRSIVMTTRAGSERTYVKTVPFFFVSLRGDRDADTKTGTIRSVRAEPPGGSLLPNGALGEPPSRGGSVTVLLPGGDAVVNVWSPVLEGPSAFPA